jgi:hypothetical protein
MSTPFKFTAPAWANEPKRELSAEEALHRAEDLAQEYYPLGAQTGIHSMIEWCGVMTEYVKMLKVAMEAGHDPRKVDQHRGSVVAAPDFMVEYFCEKLGCQLKPFIAAEPKDWRAAIEKWFPKKEAVAPPPPKDLSKLFLERAKSLSIAAHCPEHPLRLKQDAFEAGEDKALADREAARQHLDALAGATI